MRQIFQREQDTEYYLKGKISLDQQLVIVSTKSIVKISLFKDSITCIQYAYNTQKHPPIYNLYLIQTTYKIMDNEEPNNPNHNTQPTPSSNPDQQPTNNPNSATQGTAINENNIQGNGGQQQMHDQGWESDEDDEESSFNSDEDDDGYEIQVMDDEEEDSGSMDDDDMEDESASNSNIAIRTINLDALTGPMNIIFSNLKKTTPLIQLIKVPPSKKITKQVCAKVIKRGDTVIECFNCRMDQTCIICLDCFKNGNHEGHRYLVKTGGGGCCDCGDPQAWSQNGFCTKHSGKFVDFQIKEDIVQEFSNSINGLMYIYFQLVIRDAQYSQLYVKRLIEFLTILNHENTYYNKLTALCLTKKLPPQFSLNEELDKCTILQNILTSKISRKYFSKWFQLFITMFSYYPFKLAILKHYIQNFGKVIDGNKQSTNHGISISCQLITSFKLVEQYSLENNIGIGQKSKKPTKIKQIIQYYAMLTHDISSLASLSENAPYYYWKMHINSQEGIRNLFYYYKVIMKKVKKQETTKSQAEICAIYINFAEVELNVVQAFTNIIKVVSQDEILLGKVISTLWGECEKTWSENPESLCILRPLQRCLTIALFAYFNHSLQKIKQNRQKLIKDVLKIHPEKFETGCKMILARMWKTLFFYAKSQAQSGLGQTLYLYLYIYKIYSRILIMTDLLSVKIFMLLLDRQYPITFQSAIGLDHNKLENQAYLKEKTNFFFTIVKTVKLIYTHFCPEIYVSYSIDGERKMYQKQIITLILNYFKEYSKEDTYSVPQNQLKTQLLEGILPKQCKVAENWIKNNCNLNKKNKSYSLDKNIFENTQSKIIGLNFDDFHTNVNSKDPFADCMKSVVAVTGSNLQVFNFIWNEISMQSLSKTIHTLYDKQDLENQLPLLPFLCCIYLTGKQNKIKSEEENQFLKQILIKFSTKIPKNLIPTLQLEAISGQTSAQSLQQKKKKFQDLKAKKLQKMKQKQQNFLINQAATEEAQQLKLNKQQSQNKLQQKCCCICRNDLNQNSVYIVNMNIRNHQRLLKLGSGVEYLNFSSCRHVFDYKCIEKMYKKNSILSSITCPLCKSSGNIIFPVMDKFNSKFEEEIANRVVEILKEIKNNADFYEQIVKCFYHYFLLCAIDLKRTLETKRELYRTIFLILRKNIPEKQLMALKQKLSSGKISKIYEKDLIQHKKQSQKSSMSFFLNLLVNQNQQAAQIQEIVLDMNKKQSIKDPKSLRNKLVEKMDTEQKTKEFWLFRESIGIFLDYLSTGQNQYSEMQSEQNGNSFIVQCIKTLTSENLQDVKFMEQKSVIDIENLQVLRELPKRYSSIGALKKCSACSQMSVELITCLLCQWCGCQNCKEGDAKTHINTLHGQVGAVMLINKATAYYINNQKTILAGQLYQDEWQKSLKNATNWEQFQLNTSLYNQMQRRLKYDEIPTRHAKLNKQ